MSDPREINAYLRVTVRAVTTLPEEDVRLLARKLAQELGAQLIMLGDRTAVVSLAFQRGVDPVREHEIIPLIPVEK